MTYKHLIYASKNRANNEFESFIYNAPTDIFHQEYLLKKYLPIQIWQLTGDIFIMQSIAQCWIWLSTAACVQQLIGSDALRSLVPTTTVGMVQRPDGVRENNHCTGKGRAPPRDPEGFIGTPPFWQRDDSSFLKDFQLNVQNTILRLARFKMMVSIMGQ